MCSLRDGNIRIGAANLPSEYIKPASTSKVTRDDVRPEEFAFVSHLSACEALRTLDGTESRWPQAPRMLPVWGRCVTNQRGFKELASRVDLSSHGIFSRPVDLLVPSQYMRSRGKGARFHVWARLVPKGSFFRVGHSLLVSTPELLIVQLVSSQAKFDELFDVFMDRTLAERDALESLGIDDDTVDELPQRWESTRRIIAATVVACEFAGTYRLGTAGEGASGLGPSREDTRMGAVRYHMRPLVTVDAIRRMADDPSVSFVGSRVRTVADLAFDGSASPMETSLALMLTMPPDLGGFGLPKPLLNKAIDTPAENGALFDRDRVTPDMLWEGQRVALEYDSAGFHGRSGLARPDEDARRANILTTLGYDVFRVTSGMVRTLPELERLALQLAVRLGVELAEPDGLQATRRRKAFAELMPGRAVGRSDVR